MTGQEASLVERLRGARSPHELLDWERENGYYVAACRVSAEDVPGLIALARKWLDPDWPGNEDGPDIDPEDAGLLPVTAWRALADLKADAAVEPLVDMLRELDEEYDNQAIDELPHVFGKIGESAVQPLTHLAEDVEAEQFIRSIAARALRRVADYHPNLRDPIVACLTKMMAGAAEDHLDFNTTVLAELVELQAAEAAEPIERAFAGNLLDVGMMGDWEEVRRRLGVEGLGMPMPEKPHNSMERFRRRMGIGIFSDRPLFLNDGHDDDAQEAYHKRAFDTFSKSSQAQQVVDRYGDLGWFQSLLRFGIDYLGEAVDEMTLGSVQEFVLDYAPRKVSTEPDKAESIIGELTMFWEYLDLVYQLPAAKSIVEWLKSDGLVSELEAELSDPANYGMAKSLFMMGNSAGYDMTSEAGLAEFIAAYNQSLISEPAPAATPPPAQKRRVGRNDPCPCGSGKKYKKCCM